MGSFLGRLPKPVLPAGVVLLVLLCTQVLMPGTPGDAGRGTPIGVLFDGVVEGSIAALSAVGIVLVYRTLRIINFAQTAIGIAGSTFGFNLLAYTPLPFPVVLLLALLLGAIGGAATGALLLRFGQSSRLVLTVVTIVGSTFLVRLASQINRLPFFPQGNELTIEQQSLTYSFRPLLPLGGWEFKVGGYPITFGFRHAFALELALLLLLVVGAFYRYTRYGTALRAVAENPQRASLLGISVGGMSIVVFAIAGVLSTAGTTLTGYLSTASSASGFAPETLIVALCAAVVARMESLPIATIASVLIFVGDASFRYSFPDHTALITVVLLVVLVAALLLGKGERGRSEAGQAVSWSAVEEQRPVPRELASLGPVRAVRWALIGAFGLFLVLVPFVFSPRFTDQASVLCLGAIVTLSLVVLTGWGGQVSLGQVAFSAVGAIVGGALTATVGLPFWLAVPLAAAVTGAIAALVGLPALRIPGLFLLPVTFAFAYMVSSVFFDERYTGWLLPDESELRRPTLFLLNFEDNTSMYFLCVACLGIATLVVANLRRSRTGRVLIALRDNDANVQAFGVDAVRTKLLAFAISGALAGFSGAVFVHQQLGLDVQSFDLQRGVNKFLEAVFGGIGSGSGALLGSAFFTSTSYLGLSEILGLFIENGAVLFLIFASPAGLIALVQRGRDSVLRVIAQRRQIVVPSLFTDVDPAALAEQVVPLAAPEPTSGLAVLDPDERWKLPSVVHRRQRRQPA